MSYLERDGHEVYFEVSGEGAGGGHLPVLSRASRGMLAQRDARVIESLPAIMVPVLVLVGERDRPFRAAAGPRNLRIPDSWQRRN